MYNIAAMDSLLHCSPCNAGLSIGTCVPSRSTVQLKLLMAERFFTGRPCPAGVTVARPTPSRGSPRNFGMVLPYQARTC